MKRIKFILAVLLVVSVGFKSYAVNVSLKPGKLSCEYVENPLGITALSPRFSWLLTATKNGERQTAYELLVSDNLKTLKSRQGNCWESGKVNSSQSLHVNFKGAGLQSFKRYYWMVRVYDAKGRASSWSAPAWFETAMLSPADWKAKWIWDGSKQFQRDEDFYKEDRAPLFKKVFKSEKKVLSARLYISGLGYYEAYLNGKKVGDRMLDPGWTSYSKEVLYTVYDITKLVKGGLNTAGVMLGNGFYNPLPLRLFNRFNIRDAQQTGRPCVKAEIHVTYADGEKSVVLTDESWKTAPGPILKNSSYLGEHYDARLEPTDWHTSNLLQEGGWKNAVLSAGPSGVLAAQLQPGIKVTKILDAVGVKEVKPGVFVYDMGQNFAGVARIKVAGPAGTRIKIRYGEDIYADGTLNVMTSVTGQIKHGHGGPGAPAIAWQEDNYILKGKGTEEWNPRFTFHGFRYVEITGWPGTPALDAVRGLRMNADLAQDGTFACSNDLFNKINVISDWTFLSNVFSVQSDCPAREKLGYGGDIVATAESYLYKFNMANFYRKAMSDFENDQRDNGGFTETAPFVGISDKSPGGGSGPLGWQLAYPFLVKQLFEFYGDTAIVNQGYQAMRKQVAFLQSSAKDNLFNDDISDHESIEDKPVALTASLFYFHHVSLMSAFAKVSGDPAGASKYAALASDIKSAIIRKFHVQGTGQFDNGQQAAQIFALWYDLPDADSKSAALKKLDDAFAKRDWHIATGIFATKMMFDVFRTNDKNEQAYQVANQRGFPGWGYMVERGATTLWETWAYSDNVFSQNHPMFGSINEWFYRSLLGINSGKAGFEHIILKPQPAGDLSWARGSYASVRGVISSSWKIVDGLFSMDVAIPPNTTAEVWLPTKGGLICRVARKADTDYVQFLRSESGYDVYHIASGKYNF